MLERCIDKLLSCVNFAPVYANPDYEIEQDVKAVLSHVAFQDYITRDSELVLSVNKVLTALEFYNDLSVTVDRKPLSINYQFASRRCHKLIKVNSVKQNADGKHVRVTEVEVPKVTVTGLPNQNVYLW